MVYVLNTLSLILTTSVISRHNIEKCTPTENLCILDILQHDINKLFDETNETIREYVNYPLGSMVVGISL